MLTLIQGFHPPGVGARDLRECLLIRLKREGRENSLEHKIVSEHMEDLGRRRFPKSRVGWGSGGGHARPLTISAAKSTPWPESLRLAANYVLPDVTVERWTASTQSL